MGADSWREIRTWKDWEKVLLAVNHIVVSRPGFDIGFDHVTHEISDRITDLRGLASDETKLLIEKTAESNSIFITDAVELPISATAIRDDAQDGELDQRGHLPDEVAKYIEKYELYR
jgi:nicotinate-nucleotide adenylyltransferase